MSLGRGKFQEIGSRVVQVQKFWDFSRPHAPPDGTRLAARCHHRGWGLMWSRVLVYGSGFLMSQVMLVRELEGLIE